MVVPLDHGRYSLDGGSFGPRPMWPGWWFLWTMAGMAWMVVTLDHGRCDLDGGSFGPRAIWRGWWFLWTTVDMAWMVVPLDHGRCGLDGGSFGPRPMPPWASELRVFVQCLAGPFGWEMVRSIFARAGWSQPELVIPIYHWLGILTAHGRVTFRFC